MAARKRKQPPLKLTGINDDCLMQILGYLDKEDLYMVARVCKRLKWIAGNVFASKWKELRFTINDMPDTAHAIDYLRQFGAQIPTIRLIATDKLKKAAYNILLNVMVRYCGGSLSCLELHGFSLDSKKSSIEAARPLLARVQHLILEGCVASVKWFVSCPELVELDLNGTYVTYNGARNQACPKLEVLKIKGAQNWVKKGLNLFLEQNGQLKTFEGLFHPKIHRNRDSAPYESILDFVPATIECLTTTPLGLTKTVRFPALKTVRIFAARYADAVLMNVNPDKIEYLSIDLERSHLDGRIAADISKFRNLKSLNLICEKVQINDLIDMIKNLSNLAEVVLSTQKNTLDAEDFLKMIQYGPNLQRLIVSFGYISWGLPAFRMNAEIYRKMLRFISERSNGKSLHIILIMFSNFEAPVDLKFPMDESLKITCLSFEYVADLLNFKRYGLYGIEIEQITEDELKMLSDLRLCP